MLLDHGRWIVLVDLWDIYTMGKIIKDVSKIVKWLLKGELKWEGWEADASFQRTFYALARGM